MKYLMLTVLCITLIYSSFIYFVLAPEYNKLQGYIDNYVSVSTKAIQNDMITKQGKVKP